ncbi:MAG: caspase family protein [Caldilineaceae bacterium]
MTHKFALLICNNEYSDETLTRLIAPNEDANALASVLKDSQIGKFDNVDVVSNKSSQLILEAIADFYAQKNRDDLLLLYFTGHGVLDTGGHLYLAASNTKRNILRATGVPARFITEEMDNCRSRRQLLILDCCHSGAFSRGSKGTIGQAIGTASLFQGNGYGRVVLTATDATQYAWEDDSITGEGKRSIFTEYIVNGLQTGKADLNGDGTITVDELYDYVYEKIVSLARENRQTPGKWSYKQEGDLILVESLATKTSQIVKIFDARNLSPTRELIRRTYDTIVPFMVDVSSRQAILVLSLGNDHIYYEIDFSGSAFVFTNRLIDLLIAKPELKDGGNAIEELLGTLKGQVGVDKQRILDDLISEWSNVFKGLSLK